MRVTIDAGPYYVCARVHNVVLDNVPAYISTEHGAIETWYKQITDPVAYSHNPYRIFDGSFGLGAGTVFESQGDGLPTGRLRFGLQFGAPAVAEVYADDGIVGYNISAYNGTWIHVAGVWDRAGIDGSSDTLRLYVNGDLVARSTHADWGSVVGNQADICGGNDDLIAQQFYMDNLKVWGLCPDRLLAPLGGGLGSRAGVAGAHLCGVRIRTPAVAAVALLTADRALHARVITAAQCQFRE